MTAPFERIRPDTATRTAGSRPAWLRHAPLVLLLLIFNGTGLAGLDFGHHWDEHDTAASLENSVRSGLILPLRYVYPGVRFWIGVVVAAPEYTRAMLSDMDPDQGAARAAVLAEGLGKKSTHLRLRLAYLVLTSLAMVWLYLLVLIWRGSMVEALVAAAVLGTSWEIAYHARWMAPDAVMMQFGAMTILFSVLAVVRAQPRRWLLLAAAAAGLATGTKYPGGALLLMPLTAAVCCWDRRSAKALRLDLARIVVVFGGVYLLTTPGTLFDPLRFIEDVRRAQAVYAEGHHVQYVTAGFFSHLVGILHYLVRDLLSPFLLGALALAAAAVVGAVDLWRRERRAAFVLAVFPVFYALYFSTQAMLIVRNLLVLAPFIALLSARGLACLARWLPRPELRIGLAVSVSAIFAANMLWLVHAAATIRDRGTPRFVHLAFDYMERQPETTFFVSAKLRDQLDAVGAGDLPNASGDADTADVALFYASEGAHTWRANHRQVERWFGPCEVNFHRYPTWKGDDRILVMSMERARELDVRAVRERKVISDQSSVISLTDN